jgi:hypothetical protein
LLFCLVSGFFPPVAQQPMSSLDGLIF